MQDFKIDIDSYTDGDPQMEREIISLMVDNMKELEKSLAVSVEEDDYSHFKKTSHKVYPSICMVNYPDFTAAIQKIKETQGDEQQQSITLFKGLCTHVISTLEGKLA